MLLLNEQVPISTMARYGRYLGLQMSIRDYTVKQKLIMSYRPLLTYIELLSSTYGLEFLKPVRMAHKLR